MNTFRSQTVDCHIILAVSLQKDKKLLVQTVERMSKRFNLDIRVLSEVVKINKEENNYDKECNWMKHITRI